MDTQSILQRYYDAWLKGHREIARGLLNDDLVFRSPNDNFDSADAFFDACWQFAADFEEMNLIQEVYGEDAAYIAYTFSDYRVGEFHRFRDGKIAEIYVTFNPTT